MKFVLYPLLLSTFASTCLQHSQNQNLRLLYLCSIVLHWYDHFIKLIRIWSLWHQRIHHKYWEPVYGSNVVGRMLQANWGRGGKQQQRRISPNHLQAIWGHRFSAELTTHESCESCIPIPNHVRAIWRRLVELTALVQATRGQWPYRLISDKKCGPIYSKYPKKTKFLKSSFLKTSILQSGFLKLWTTSQLQYELNLSLVA